MYDDWIFPSIEPDAGTDARDKKIPLEALPSGGGTG
jgi:hypothetical protein